MSAVPRSLMAMSRSTFPMRGCGFEVGDCLAEDLDGLFGDFGQPFVVGELFAQFSDFTSRSVHGWNLRMNARSLPYWRDLWGHW